MQFKPGDRVRFLNDTGEAKVVQMISATEVLVVDDSGFDYPYLAKELVLIEGKIDEESAYRTNDPDVAEIMLRNVDPAKLKAANKDFNLKYKNEGAGNAKKRGTVLEVDLHIHELVDSDLGLDPGDKLEIQMQHFNRMMRHAETERINRVVLIHGVGAGVLRSEIRKQLDMYFPHAVYHDASYAEYGYGATEVIIRQR